MPSRIFISVLFVLGLWIPLVALADDSERPISAWLTLSTKPERIADAQTGLRLWGESGLLDHVILQASPIWVGDVLPQMVDVCQEHTLPVVPAISVAPALKAATDPNGKRYWQLDDVDGWRVVANAITEAVRITGSRRVGLDWELATEGYRYDRGPVDLARVAEGVRQLPKGVTLIVRPTVTDSNPVRRERQRTLLLILLAEHSDIVFISQTYASIWAWKRSAANLAEFAELHQEWYGMKDRPLYQYLWLFGPDSKYLQDDEGMAFLSAIPDGDIPVLYLGARDWVRNTERWITLLQYRRGHQ